MLVSVLTAIRRPKLSRRRAGNTFKGRKQGLDWELNHHMASDEAWSRVMLTLACMGVLACAPGASPKLLPADCHWDTSAYACDAG